MTTTTKALNTKISRFITGEKKKRDALQALLVECIQHGRDNGNSFDCLSNLIRGLIEAKSRNSKAIREYILEHVKGISWQKNKAGVYMYKVTGEEVQYLELSYPWYNHKGNMATNNNKEVSLASVKQYFKTLSKRMEENGVKADDKAKLDDLISSADAILSA